MYLFYHLTDIKHDLIIMGLNYYDIKFMELINHLIFYMRNMLYKNLNLHVMKLG